MELEELWKARKGDERKGLLAEIMQAETTVRLDWISGQWEHARGAAERLAWRANVCRKTERPENTGKIF